jgi:hypothetical protein
MRDSIKPVLRAGRTNSLNPVPSMLIGRTNSNVKNQGYTYNESGLTYNQSGVMYGGLYEYDIYPIIARAIQDKSMIYSGIDFSGTVVPTIGNSGMLIGMLGLTYP